MLAINKLSFVFVFETYDYDTLLLSTTSTMIQSQVHIYVIRTLLAS